MFLFGQQTKFKIKIQTPLTNEGTKPPVGTDCSLGKGGCGSGVSAWGQWKAICG